MGWVQIAGFLAIVLALMPPLGGYMARVFTGERTLLAPVLGPLERGVYAVLRVDPTRGQDWKAYARAVLAFSLLGWLALYLILRTQTLHPFNPGDFHSGSADLSFNTTSSFVTNTNWQYYGGETTLTNFAQMAGLTVQNFVSAAVGLAVAVALVRGLVARRTKTAHIGNFWQDLVRANLYVLLPIAFVAALVLASQGVLQSLGHGLPWPQIPTASQEAIKELGTNGGGIFNVNSAMPLENPNGFTNLLEMVLIICIPVALTWTYGRMVGSRRQGYTLLATMGVIFVAGVVVCYLAELHGTPAQHAAGLHGANLEGKEVRFGASGSALWTAVTSATSCGAVNAAFESLTGIGGLIPFANLSFSETIFGGVGTGLYSILLFVLLAVFIGGLMVGRTPEFLGKKIEAREMKLVSLGAIFTPMAALISSALATGTKWGDPSVYARGPQGFSESLYAYLSQANNNGSAFAGYTGYSQPDPGNVGAHGITFADLLGGSVMVLARFAPILFALAVAGSLATKRVAPTGPGTLRTDSPTFTFLLIGVIVIVGALTFFPAVLLGPVVQGLTGHLF